MLRASFVYSARAYKISMLLLSSFSWSTDAEFENKKQRLTVQLFFTLVLSVFPSFTFFIRHSSSSSLHTAILANVDRSPLLSPLNRGVAL